MLSSNNKFVSALLAMIAIILLILAVSIVLYVTFSVYDYSACKASNGDYVSIYGNKHCMHYPDGMFKR